LNARHGLDPARRPDTHRVMTDIVALKRQILAGERRALARAITLIESTREDHREAAGKLLVNLQEATGKAIRIGISGPPGAGKSTFIEAFGLALAEQGKTVGVLAVDPSSSRTGGSILGDKTRMEQLARHANAFIRPSPSGGTLGGVARRTRETIGILEAGGFDVVIVETVGVGQSEIAVSDMTDLFILLIAPGGGDELQGIKRGVMELADLVLVNKADGDLKAPARRTAADYAQALRFMRPKFPCWTPKSLLISARQGEGLDAVWEAVLAHHEALTRSGSLDDLRANQAKAWMWADIREGIAERFRQNPAVLQALAETEQAVANGTEPPSLAARRLLQLFGGNTGEPDGPP